MSDLITVTVPFSYNETLKDPDAENLERFLNALKSAGRRAYRTRYPRRAPESYANPWVEHPGNPPDPAALDLRTVAICEKLYRAVMLVRHRTVAQRRRSFLTQLIERLGKYRKGRHKGEDYSLAAAARVLDAYLQTIPYRDALLFLDGRQQWWGQCNHVCEDYTSDENGEIIYEGWAPSLIPTFPAPLLRSKKSTP